MQYAMSVPRNRRMMLMSLLLTVIVIITPDFEAQAQEPRNISRAENETDVFIPCPFGFRPSPSIWKINGTDYFGATLPPIFTQIPGGLFINTVNRCLNHTSFQCIDISGETLQGEASDIGFLTVTSERACVEDDEFFLTFNRPASPGVIAIDHQRTMFGSINTTLAWISTSEDTSCNTSQILSNPPCQSGSTPELNIVTNEMKVTVQSESFQISGRLADFNISSFSDQPSGAEECPTIPVAIRVNVTQTKLLNLLAGSNNCTCTCVNIDCRKSACGVAISKPDMSPPDVLCPIYTLSSRSCYNPDRCNGFSGTPFFRFCESQNLAASSGCNYNMCFGNITEELNGTRLDFYNLNKTICDSGPSYFARVYALSFELNVRNASTNVSVDTTTGEICFYSSPQECSLTQLTQYNVSITDITRNLIFMKEVIPESSCVNIQTILYPQCFPFSMSIQPLNSYIVYSSIHQLIEADDAAGAPSDDVCSCINETVRDLRFTAVQGSSMLTIEYHCSTDYLTPLNITVIVRAGNPGTLHQSTIIVCSTGRFSVNNSFNQCGQTIEMSGYWIFTDVNDTVSTCSLSSHSIVLPCPTISPTPNPGIIAGVVIAIMAIIIIAVAIILCYVLYKYGYLLHRRSLNIQTDTINTDHCDVQLSLHRENLQERGTNITDSGDQLQDET